MIKKIVILIILILAIVFLTSTLINEDIEVYIDGENVTTTVSIMSNEKDLLSEEICSYVSAELENPSSDITTIKNGILEISRKYGLNNPNIKINSIIGENQLPLVVTVEGTSMDPTLKNGQKVLVKKTKDIHIGDIVVSKSDDYGDIIKRVGDINADNVYLKSDNKQIDYHYKNGYVYEEKGITTWVNINNITGVVINY